jgi:type I restriction enzyme S subunit
MSKKSAKGLVPELRFPEFRKAAGWQEEPFGKLYSFIVTNSLSRDKLNYTAGEVKNIHYGDIHTKFATLFDVTNEKVPYINEDVPLAGYDEESYCAEGDMVFADASEDLEGVGKGIEVYKLNNERVLAGLHTLHARQTTKKLARGFGGYLFLSDRIRGQVKRESQGAKVLGISGPRLSNVLVSYPSSKDEQQKIAACLSSVDALLAAEREKLEALREHKKGLMQQLFPAEGAKVPKLRFRGFGGEWESRPLGSVCDMKAGTFIKASDILPKSGDGLYPCYGGNGLRGYAESFTHDGMFPLVGRQGALCGNVTLAIGRFHATEHALVASGKSGVAVDTLWLYHVLVHANLNKYAIGQAQPGLSVERLDSVLIPYVGSTDEQYEIARCLTSMDDRIALQAERIEIIEAHKRGLMQGLFPTANYERG